MERQFLCLPAILITIIAFQAANAATISITTPTKCFGNTVLIGLKCTPCLSDEIAKNNKCLKITGFAYGSNLAPNPSSSQNVNNTSLLPFCSKANPLTN